MAHPDFGRLVNPISTRGTDYAHLITTGSIFRKIIWLDWLMHKCFDPIVKFIDDALSRAVRRSENPGVPVVIRWA